MSRIAVYALGLGASILIARSLGPEGRGRYFFPVTVVSIVTVFGHLSLEQAAIHLYATRGATLSQLWSHMSAAAACLGGCAIGILLAWRALDPGQLFAGIPLTDMVIAGAAIPFSIHLLYAGNILTLSRRLARLNAAQIIGALLQLILIVSMSCTDRLDVRSVLLICTFSIAATWFLTLLSLSREPGFSKPSAGHIWREMLLYGLFIHPGILLAFLHLRIDILFVKQMTDMAQVGFYSLAVTLAELIWISTDSLAAAILPVQTDPDANAAGAMTARSCRLSLFAATLLAVGLGLAGGHLITLCFGPAFAPSMPCLMLLLPGIVSFTVQRACGNYLHRTGRPFRISAIIAGEVALNIALNLVFIPPWGARGAALASSISYATGSILFLAWFLRASGTPWREAVFMTSDDLRRVTRALTPSPQR